MASTTIIAPAAAVALERARELAERNAFLDGYESFRLIKDAFEEPPRASVDDVESVLSVLKGSLSMAAGQNVWESGSAFEGEAFMYNPQIPGSGPKRDNQRSASTSLQKPVHMSGQGLVEGRSWFLRLSPGVAGLRCADLNKKERAQAREEEKARRMADLARGCAVCPIMGLRVKGGAVGEIKEWSARSRSRMSERVGSLDYSEWDQSEGTLAMVTLTLPSWWEAVAPDGKTFKVLLRKFEKRWSRNIGTWRGLWKLEFQRRGAPHWHALLRVPALVGRFTFEEWLSKTWADVVGASDEIDRCKLRDRSESSEYSRHLASGTGVDYSGKDFSDPRRISLYFLGHSSKTTDNKQYQHIVPKDWQEPGKGPGRFWGNPGLSSAFREIEISERDAVAAARVLRKVKRARAWTTAVLRDRGALDVGQRHLHKTFSVEVRAKAGQKFGRAAMKTRRRKAAAAAALKGETAVHGPRFVPSSLGAGGYAVGGWVLVNDGLQLGLDLARYFSALADPYAGSAYCLHETRAKAIQQPAHRPDLPAGAYYPIQKTRCQHG